MANIDSKSLATGFVDSLQWWHTSINVCFESLATGWHVSHSSRLFCTCTTKRVTTLTLHMIRSGQMPFSVSIRRSETRFNAKQNYITRTKIIDCFRLLFVASKTGTKQTLTVIFQSCCLCTLINFNETPNWIKYRVRNLNEK